MEGIKTIKIANLKPTSRRINLRARILEIGESKEVISKKSGEQRRLAEALIGDETGTILLTLWDDKIEAVEVGGTYDFKNAFVTVFKGSMRLNVGKYGEIEKSSEEISEEEVNREKNLSEEKVTMRKGYYPRGRYGRRNQYR